MYKEQFSKLSVEQKKSLRAELASDSTNVLNMMLKEQDYDESCKISEKNPIHRIFEKYGIYIPQRTGDTAEECKDYYIAIIELWNELINIT